MIREIDTAEAQDVVRQWPARRQDIDYAAHTSECADYDYDEPPMPLWAGWVLVAVMLASAASMVSLIMWLLP